MDAPAPPAALEIDHSAITGTRTVRICRQHAVVGLIVLGTLASYAYTTKRYGYAADPRIADPLLYYMPALSWYFDHDCDYRNQILQSPKFQHDELYLSIVSEQGRVILYHPVAWSVVAMPFLAMADGATALHNLFSSVPLSRDGYSAYYMWIVPLSHVLVGLAGVLAGYALALRYFGPAVAASATFVVWIGSNVAYFIGTEPTMSHAASLSFVTLAVYLADTIARHGWTWRRAVWLGVFGGMMGATRYYNVMWTVAPAALLLGPLVGSAYRREAGAWRHVGMLAVSCLVACCCFVPQLLTNLINEGMLLGKVGMYAPNWASPDFVAELSCLRLFPALCVAGVGGLALVWRFPRSPLAWGLLASFALHVYVYACATVPGYSRRYLACFPFFVMGLCVLLDWARSRPRWRLALVGVLGVFCLRNVALMWLVDQGEVHRRVFNDLLLESPSVVGILLSAR